MISLNEVKSLEVRIQAKDLLINDDSKINGLVPDLIDHLARKGEEATDRTGLSETAYLRQSACGGPICIIPQRDQQCHS